MAEPGGDLPPADGGARLDLPGVIFAPSPGHLSL
jgi:hypothetical protein